MYINTKVRYAIIALMELVDKTSPVSLQLIAHKNQLSQNYLEQLFAKLKKKGIVISARGTNGGYVLAKTPGEIDLYDVFNATMDEPFDLTPCKSKYTCREQGIKCDTHDVWAAMSANMETFLKNMSLENVCKKDCIF